LRLVLVLVNLFILAIPVSGLSLFRIYENELVRQTETELIAQAALVGAMYKNEILAAVGPNYGRKISNPAAADDGGRFRLAPPVLDLSRDEILGRRLSYSYSPYDPDPAAAAAAARLEPVLKEAGRTNLSSVVVLDFRGIVVAGQSGHGLSMAGNAEISEALNGLHKSVMRTRERQRRRDALVSAQRYSNFRVFVAAPVMNRDRLLGVVYLSRTPRDVIDALSRERRRLLLTVAIVLGLMLVISLATSIMIIAPVRRLADEATAVAEGRRQGFGDERPLIAVRELADLRAVVADMAERLRRRSDYLKAFADGVSHEFKTPLTSIKGALEIIGEHGRTMAPEVRERFEANIRADLDRLERLTSRLLALARAEAVSQAGGDRCDAAALTRRLASHYELSGLAVKAPPPPAAFELDVPADVLETVLRNLFDNSRESGAAATTVDFALDPSGKTGRITVTDNGPGIQAQNAEAIFTPFYTTHKNQGGTGLGLSLARTLISPYRGELTWAGNQPGAVFTLVLPLSR
jgi:signal transduction histidine kinase